MAAPLLIAGIIAMVAGAAMQAKAASDAASRQRSATEEAMRRQQEYQREAEERALEQAEQFKNETRKETQDELTEELTQQFYQPVEAAMVQNNAKSTTQGAVSSDYLAAKAKSNASQQQMARELAALFGKQKAATQMRRNEALGLADAASDIGRIGNFASGQYGVDKMKIQEAGTPDPGLNFLGGTTSSVGSAMVGASGGGK